MMYETTTGAIRPRERVMRKIMNDVYEKYKVYELGRLVPTLKTMWSCVGKGQG